MTMASRLVMQAYGASSRRSGSNPPSRRWPRMGPKRCLRPRAMPPARPVPPGRPTTRMRARERMSIETSFMVLSSTASSTGRQRCKACRWRTARRKQRGSAAAALGCCAGRGADGASATVP